MKKSLVLEVTFNNRQSVLKQLGKILLSSILVMCIASCESGSDELAEELPPNDSQEPVEFTFKQQTENADFTPVSDHTVTAFRGKLWLIGGRTFTQGADVLSNDVWSSSDGIEWTLENDEPGFGPVYRHSTVVFQDKLWVLAFGEVWSSADGITWEESTLNTAEIPFGNFEALVFKNKIWMFHAGIVQNPFSGREVWSSADGTNWELEIENAEYPQRFRRAMTVFNDKIWIIGGDGTETPGSGPSQSFNDVWSSVDGISWSQETEDAGFLVRSGHSVTVYENKMWLTCGRSDTIDEDRYDLMDLWSSSNGTDWEKVSDLAYPLRDDTQFIEHNNNLFVVGGGRLTAESFNDVWSFR